MARVQAVEGTSCFRAKMHCEQSILSPIVCFSDGRGGEGKKTGSCRSLKWTVVDSSGRLVGVISNFGEVAAGEKCVGMLPIAHLALPRWAWRLAVSGE